VGVLVVNARSSSLKVDLIEDGEWAQSYDGLPGTAPGVDAVGHRIVHGGPHLVEPVVVNAAVEKQLRDLVQLAPLHQPKSLHGLDAARRLLPGVPHVACFDKAFHAPLPPEASSYALPAAWRQHWGVRRYGFHGLSHSWASRRAGELAPGSRRVVSCHLGAGASLAAVLDGRSVDTTMGFTPLDGLLLWLEEQEHPRPHEVADALEHASGLLALAGTSDMKQLLDRSDPDAVLAVAVYLHHLTAGIAAMAAALGGLDTLVSTGWVGEHAPALRGSAAARLSYLGMAVDGRLNTGAQLVDSGDPDVDISADGAAAHTLVERSREDLQIAAGVEQALGVSVPAVRA
jgi:acetate kinase